MSTTKDIVRRALRLLGVLASGKEPSGADASDGLERLQSIVLGLPGMLHNAIWREVSVSGAFTAREGDRCTVTDPGVVSLPAAASLGRPPRDMARVQIIGAAADNAGLWIYSATNGVWGQVDGLTITSTMPFGAEDDGGLAAQLAVDLVDEYGAQVSDRTIALARISVASLRSRLKKAGPTDWSRPEPGDPLGITGAEADCCEGGGSIDYTAEIEDAFDAFGDAFEEALS